MTDLRFDQATAEEFRAFWEGQGFEVNVWSCRDGDPDCIDVTRTTKSEDCLWLSYHGGQVLPSVYPADDGPDSAVAFGTPITTFGEALEILNEIAATRAFGGWADSE